MARTRSRLARFGAGAAGRAARLARRGGQASAGAAASAGRAAFAALGGPTGRRLGRTAALTLTLALLVVVLYEHGDVPSAAARVAPSDGARAGQAGGRAGTRAGAAGERPAAGRDAGSARKQGAASRRVGERPAEVAAAWYAARHHLPPKQVRPLQQDRVSAREVRVLVLADPGGGRVRTALVRVRLGRSGWAVP
jgi:hypothetical protein